MEHPAWLASLLLCACAGRTEAEPEAQQVLGLDLPTPELSESEVEWSEVEREIEAHVCLRAFDIPGHGTVVEPVYGVREVCLLPPPETPLERAVERAWERAIPMINATRHEWEDDARATLSEPDDARKLAAAREVYLRSRSLAELLRHLHPALAEVGLSCPMCPVAVEPTPRTVSWEDFSPYLFAYVWPESAPDASYQLRICIGDNGISELPAPDGALIELGFLAAFHTMRLREQAKAEFVRLQTEPKFARTPDAERTRWLHAELIRSLTSDAEVVRDVCATIEHFHPSTGITVSGCSP